MSKGKTQHMRRQNLKFMRSQREIQEDFTRLAHYLGTVDENIDRNHDIIAEKEIELRSMRKEADAASEVSPELTKRINIALAEKGEAMAKIHMAEKERADAYLKIERIAKEQARPEAIAKTKGTEEELDQDASKDQAILAMDKSSTEVQNVVQ